MWTRWTCMPARSHSTALTASTSSTTHLARVDCVRSSSSRYAMVLPTIGVPLLFLHSHLNMFLPQLTPSEELVSGSIICNRQDTSLSLRERPVLLQQVLQSLRHQLCCVTLAQWQRWLHEYAVCLPHSSGDSTAFWWMTGQHLAWALSGGADEGGAGGSGGQQVSAR